MRTALAEREQLPCGAHLYVDSILSVSSAVMPGTCSMSLARTLLRAPSAPTSRSYSATMAGWPTWDEVEGVKVATLRADGSKRHTT